LSGTAELLVYGTAVKLGRL